MTRSYTTGSYRATQPESNNVEASEAVVETVKTNNACENNVVHEQTVFIVNDEDIANIQLPSDDVQAPAVEEIPIPEDKTPIVEVISRETCSNQVESNIIPDEDISLICLPIDEPKQPVQLEEESAPVPIEPQVEENKSQVEQKIPQVVQTT